MNKDFNAEEFESRDLPFAIKRLSPNIGGEIGGIDLSRILSQELSDLICEALLIYKVIFFRDQDLSRQQHLDFAKNFGDLEIHPFGDNSTEYPEVLKIKRDKKKRGKENLWHSDVTWREKPSLGSFLRMIKCPKQGGDTLFADMCSAYESLSDEVKEKLENQVAIHDFAGFRNLLVKQGKTPEEVEEYNKRYPMPEHPVIRTHPETGKKLIYVNQAFTQYIKGWDLEESDKMLRHLYRKASIPEFQCRFAWKKNSIAFWDNRSCQHYAVSDYWPQERIVERVTIAGDRPQ